MSSREVSQERDTRFSGYGAHVGSSVEFAPTRWTGGEIVTDPTFVTKSLKPKRFYYSPIGDGVVAADGVEMKYAPRSQEPRISVIQQRTVERNGPGKAGVHVIEKVWSEGGGGYQGDKTTKFGDLNGSPIGRNRYQSDQPSNTAQNGGNAMGPQVTQIPVKSNAMPQQMTPQNHAPESAHKAVASQPSTQMYNAPNEILVKPISSQTSPKSYNSPLGINTTTANHTASPYSARSTPSQISAPFGVPLGGTNRSYNDTPNSIKSFQTSSSLYEPGMRYEVKRDYLVSNPRELIHQYATTTPINMIPGAEHTTTQITRETYNSTVEETSIGGPLPPYNAGSHVPNPNKFVRQLRDETMTASQRQANKNQQSFVPSGDTHSEQKIEEIRRQTTRYFSPNAEEIDSLTNRLVNGLNVSGNRRY